MQLRRQRVEEAQRQQRDALKPRPSLHTQASEQRSLWLGAAPLRDADEHLQQPRDINAHIQSQLFTTMLSAYNQLAWGGASVLDGSPLRFYPTAWQETSHAYTVPAKSFSTHFANRFTVCSLFDCLYWPDTYKEPPIIILIHITIVIRTVWNLTLNHHKTS